MKYFLLWYGMVWYSIFYVRFRFLTFSLSLRTGLSARQPVSGIPGMTKHSSTKTGYGVLSSADFYFAFLYLYVDSQRIFVTTGLILEMN